MPFNFEDEKYLSFSECKKIIQSTQNGLYSKRLEFAHPVDSNVIKVLDSFHIKGVFDKVVEEMVSLNFGVLLSTGITVDSSSFPGIYAILEDSCRTLGIPVPHTVITNEMNGINAMTAGTDKSSFICISNYTPKLLSIEEQKFVIAHECGHIALGHVVYHTIGQLAGGMAAMIPLIGAVAAKAVALPLNAWNRCSEITADRAGLLCCRDLKVAQYALLKIVAGFTDISNLDIDNYIEHSMNSINTYKVGILQECFEAHPLIPKRLKALEYFANSEMYYKLTNQQVPASKKLYSDAQLNKITNDLLKII